jgi:hypothetical protein
MTDTDKLLRDMALVLIALSEPYSFDKPATSLPARTTADTAAEMAELVAEMLSRARETRRELQAARAEVERLRDMLARLCAAVDYSAPRYGVDEDWADIDTLRLRMDEAKALLAKHKETNQ